MKRETIILFTLLLTLGGCFSSKNNSGGGDQIRISADNVDMKDRTELMEKRQVNRLYEGAPPVIPHRLEEAFSDYQSCMNCHHVGKHHGPNVLHEKQTNCTQCHVKMKTQEVFRPSNFKKYFPKEKLSRSNPIGPPYIPHRIQDRQNCSICHIVDGAKEELVPRHGNLINCMQCHVQLQRTRDDFIQNKKRN